MDLIVKFLFLSGKYITCAAGKTILEIINHSVKVQRHVARKYDHVTQMVGPYDNMLELMNARIEDNSVADVAAPQPGATAQVPFDDAFAEDCSSVVPSAAAPKDSEYERIFQDLYEDLRNSSTQIKCEMMNDTGSRSDRRADLDVSSVKQLATSQPQYAKHHFYGNCVDDCCLNSANRGGLVPLGDRYAHMNSLITEAPDDSYFKKNAFTVREKTPINVHSSAGIYNFKKALLAHEDTIDLGSKAFIADLKREVHYRTFSTTVDYIDLDDKLTGRLMRADSCSSFKTDAGGGAVAQKCCKRQSSWQAFESNLEKKLQRKIYRIINRNMSNNSCAFEGDSDKERQNRLHADLMRVNELAFNKLEQKVTQILIQESLKDIEEVFNRKDRLRTSFPEVRRLNFDEICSNISARIQNAVIRGLMEKKVQMLPTGIGDITDLMEEQIRPALFETAHGDFISKFEDVLRLREVPPLTNIAVSALPSPSEEQQTKKIENKATVSERARHHHHHHHQDVFKGNRYSIDVIGTNDKRGLNLVEIVTDETMYPRANHLKTRLTDSDMEDIQQRTDILESNWRAFKIFEEYLHNVMILEKADGAKDGITEKKTTTLFQAFSIDTIYNSLFNRNEGSKTEVSLHENEARIINEPNATVSVGENSTAKNFRASIDKEDFVVIETGKLNIPKKRPKMSYAELLNEREKLHREAVDKSAEIGDQKIRVKETIKRPSASKCVQSDFIVEEVAPPKNLAAVKKGESCISDFIVSCDEGAKKVEKAQSDFAASENKKSEFMKKSKSLKEVIAYANKSIEQEMEDEEAYNAEGYCESECAINEVRNQDTNDAIESLNQELYNQQDSVEPSIADLVTRLWDKPTDYLTLDPLDTNMLLLPETDVYSPYLEDVGREAHAPDPEKYNVPHQKILNLEKELKDIKTQLKSLSASSIIAKAGLDVVSDGNITEYVLNIPKQKEPVTTTKALSDTNIAISAGQPKKIHLNIYLPKNGFSKKFPIVESLMQPSKSHPRLIQQSNVKQISNYANNPELPISKFTKNMTIDPERIQKLQKSLQLKSIDMDQLRKVQESLAPSRTRQYHSIGEARCVDMDRSFKLQQNLERSKSHIPRIDTDKLLNLQRNLIEAKQISNPKIDFGKLPQLQDLSSVVQNNQRKKEPVDNNVWKAKGVPQKFKFHLISTVNSPGKLKKPKGGSKTKEAGELKMGDEAVKDVAKVDDSKGLQPPQEAGDEALSTVKAVNHANVDDNLEASYGHVSIVKVQEWKEIKNVPQVSSEEVKLSAEDVKPLVKPLEGMKQFTRPDQNKATILNDDTKSPMKTDKLNLHLYTDGGKDDEADKIKNIKESKELKASSLKVIFETNPPNEPPKIDIAAKMKESNDENKVKLDDLKLKGEESIGDKIKEELKGVLPPSKADDLLSVKYNEDKEIAQVQFKEDGKSNQFFEKLLSNSSALISKIAFNKLDKPKEDIDVTAKVEPRTNSNHESATPKVAKIFPFIPTVKDYGDDEEETPLLLNNNRSGVKKIDNEKVKQNTVFFCSAKKEEPSPSAKVEVANQHPRKISNCRKKDDLDKDIDYIIDKNAAKSNENRRKFARQEFEEEELQGKQQAIKVSADLTVEDHEEDDYGLKVFGRKSKKRHDLQEKRDEIPKQPFLGRATTITTSNVVNKIFEMNDSTTQPINVSSEHPKASLDSTKLSLDVRDLEKKKPPAVTNQKQTENSIVDIVLKKLDDEDSIPIEPKKNEIENTGNTKPIMAGIKEKLNNLELAKSSRNQSFSDFFRFDDHPPQQSGGENGGNNNKRKPEYVVENKRGKSKSAAPKQTMKLEARPSSAKNPLRHQRKLESSSEKAKKSEPPSQPSVPSRKPPVFQFKPAAVDYNVPSMEESELAYKEEFSKQNKTPEKLSKDVPQEVSPSIAPTSKEIVASKESSASKETQAPKEIQLPPPKESQEQKELQAQKETPAQKEIPPQREIQAQRETTHKEVPTQKEKRKEVQTPKELPKETAAPLEIQMPKELQLPKEPSTLREVKVTKEVQPSKEFNQSEIDAPTKSDGNESLAKKISYKLQEKAKLQDHPKVDMTAKPLGTSCKVLIRTDAEVGRKSTEKLDEDFDDYEARFVTLGSAEAKSSAEITKQDNKIKCDLQQHKLKETFREGTPKLPHKEEVPGELHGVTLEDIGANYPKKMEQIYIRKPSRTLKSPDEKPPQFEQQQHQHRGDHQHRYQRRLNTKNVVAMRPPKLKMTERVERSNRKPAKDIKEEINSELSSTNQHFNKKPNSEMTLQQIDDTEFVEQTESTKELQNALQKQPAQHSFEYHRQIVASQQQKAQMHQELDARSLGDKFQQQLESLDKMVKQLPKKTLQIIGKKIKEQNVSTSSQDQLQNQPKLPTQPTLQGNKLLKQVEMTTPSSKDQLQTQPQLPSQSEHQSPTMIPKQPNLKPIKEVQNAEKARPKPIVLQKSFEFKPLRDTQQFYREEMVLATEIKPKTSNIMKSYEFNYMESTPVPKTEKVIEERKVAKKAIHNEKIYDGNVTLEEKILERLENKNATEKKVVEISKPPPDQIQVRKVEKVTRGAENPSGIKNSPPSKPANKPKEDVVDKRAEAAKRFSEIKKAEEARRSVEVKGKPVSFRVEEENKVASTPNLNEPLKHQSWEDSEHQRQLKSDEYIAKHLADRGGIPHRTEKKAKSLQRAPKDHTELTKPTSSFNLQMQRPKTSETMVKDNAISPANTDSRGKPPALKVQDGRSPTNKITKKYKEEITERRKITRREYVETEEDLMKVAPPNETPLEVEAMEPRDKTRDFYKIDRSVLNSSNWLLGKGDSSKRAKGSAERPSSKVERQKKEPPAKETKNYFPKKSYDPVDYALSMADTIKWKEMQAKARTNIEKAKSAPYMPFEYRPPAHYNKGADKMKQINCDHLGIVWPKLKMEERATTEKTDRNKIYTTPPTLEMSTSAILDREIKTTALQEKSVMEAEVPTKVVYSFDDKYRKTMDDKEIQQKKMDYWKTLQREDKWSPIPTELTIANELYGSKILMKRQQKKIEQQLEEHPILRRDYEPPLKPVRVEKIVKKPRVDSRLDKIEAERKLRLQIQQEEEDRKKYGNVSPLLRYYLKQKEENITKVGSMPVSDITLLKASTEANAEQSPTDFNIQRLREEKKPVIINVPTEGSIYDRYPLLRKDYKEHEMRSQEEEDLAAQEAEYKELIRLERQKREAERLSAQAALMAEERSNAIERKASFANQTAVKFKSEPYGNKVSNMMKWKMRYNAHIEKLNSAAGRTFDDHSLWKKFPFLKKYRKASEQLYWPEASPTPNWNHYTQLPYNPGLTGLRNTEMMEEDDDMPPPSSATESILPGTSADGLKRYVYKQKKVNTKMGKVVNVTYLVDEDESR